MSRQNRLAEGTALQERWERLKERSQNHHFGPFGTDVNYGQIVTVYVHHTVPHFERKYGARSGPYGTGAVYKDY